MRKIFPFILLMILASSAKGQYWNDYVLEKGFNSRDYFLQPHRIISIQTKNFDLGLLGIRPDSLSEISFQPARLSQIHGNQLYIDLKGSEDELHFKPRYVYPLYAYDNAYFLPPYMVRYVERNLQPLLSVIYLGDISAKLLPGFKYGVSYELIHHEGRYYEYFPMWYYGAYDAFGVRAEASADFPELEVNIKKDGLDEKTETAHFVDAFFSMQFAKFLSAGIKLSRVQADLSGDYLRLNNYNDPNGQYSYRSNYLNQRSNEAEIRQNELTGGLLLKLSEEREIGFFSGWIDGKHSQQLTEQDSSFYSWGNPEDDEYYSRSQYSHVNQSHWLHDGYTRFGGIHGKLPLQKQVSFKFRFEYLSSERDVQNGDAMLDTSYNHYRFRYYEDDQLYNSIYTSRLSDDRIGDGDEEIVQRTGAIGITVPMYKNSLLTIALFAETISFDQLVFEDAVVNRYRNQETETPYQPKELVERFEDKTLRLQNSSTTKRLALPVVMDIYLGKGFTARIGAVKQINRFESEEVIDVWYRTDSTNVIRTDETDIETKPQRIDRYRSIPTKKSDTSTDFNFGFTFEPSQIVRFDVGMGSEWTELKFWQLGITVRL